MRCDPRCEYDSVAFYIANHAQFYFQPCGFIFVSLNRQRKSSSLLVLLRYRCRFECVPLILHSLVHTCIKLTVTLLNPLSINKSWFLWSFFFSRLVFIFTLIFFLRTFKRMHYCVHTFERRKKNAIKTKIG